MGFAAPLFLLGLTAVSVPLLIHLIGKQRAPRRRFAALDFVLRCNRLVAQRLRLRQLLLLALRALLVAAIAVMMAKPYAEAESELPALGSGMQSTVLVLDDTLSLRRRVDGQELSLRAQSRAQQLVTHAGAYADLAVLQVSRPTSPLPTLTRDKRRVRWAISTVKAGYRHATLGPAIMQAARILSGSSLPERHIVVLTDMAQHGWTEAPGNIAPGVHLHFLDLARELDVDNHAITDLTAGSADAPGPRSTKIVARICNHSGKSASLTVKLHIDEQQVARGVLPLGPWSCGDKAFQHTFASGGVFRAMASLEPDALPEDDERYLLVEVESSIRVLLVNGAPSPIRHRDELFYLESALIFPGARSQPVLTRSVPLSEPGQLRFETYDVVVIANLPAFPEGKRAELEAFVRKGGGLLIAVGDNVDPERFNRSLTNLLPQDLRGPTTAAPPGSGDALLRFGRMESDHPILSSIWSESEGAGLRQARFQRVFRLSPLARGDRRVILWYDDGSPALLETRRDQGRVLLFTSTLDRDWNDLPIRPGYLPLVQQMIRHLSRVPIQAPGRSVAVGSRATLPIPEGTRQIRLSGPEGLEQQWSKSKLADRQTLEIPVESPGFYQLTMTGVDGITRQLERDSFVANVDARESDLRRTSPRDAQGRSGAAVRAKQRVELWHGLGAVILLLLLGESFLVRKG